MTSPTKFYSFTLLSIPPRTQESDISSALIIFPSIQAITVNERLHQATVVIHSLDDYRKICALPGVTVNGKLVEIQPISEILSQNQEMAQKMLETSKQVGKTVGGALSKGWGVLSTNASKANKSLGAKLAAKKTPAQGQGQGDNSCAFADDESQPLVSAALPSENDQVEFEDQIGAEVGAEAEEVEAGEEVTATAILGQKISSGISSLIKPEIWDTVTEVARDFTSVITDGVVEGRNLIVTSTEERRLRRSQAMTTSEPLETSLRGKVSVENPQQNQTTI